MRKLFGTLFVLLIGSSSAFAQTSAPASAPQPAPPAKTSTLEKQFLKNLLADQKAIWTSPFKVQTDDLKWLVPFTAGTATLIATDRGTGDWIADVGAEHSDLVPVSKGISYAGDHYVVGGAAAAFYLIGRATGNERARETGILTAETLINSWIVSGVIKGVTQRGRPDSGEDRGRFFTGGTSFPSGHSIQIWSIATVVAHEYHDQKWVQVTAYGTATLVGLSRFTAQRHYLSDVLVGSSLGFLIGRYVYQTHHIEAEHGQRTTKWPLIAPQMDRRARAYGVTVAWTY